MSSRYKYTTVDRIFAKLERDYTSDFNEDDVIEWAGEALEAINSVKSYEEAVCFIEVKNYQCTLPKWLHAIIQIARDNNVTGSVSGTVFTAKTTDLFETTEEEEVDFNLVKQSLAIQYNVWADSNFYRNRFTPVRLKSSSFFNSIVCTLHDTPYDSCTDEYTIVMGDTVRFSFESGLVAIAYLKQATDPQTGYPLIPDTYSHTTAITTYIAMKIANKEYMNNREGSKGKLDKYERDWDWYCKQAGNIDMMPFGVDEHQNLLDQRRYILPSTTSYFNFFGNLARPEGRKYNNPMGRNRYY